ncbi:hypothetical protein Tco_0366483 [Tanacetum coccineum]
MRTRSQSRNLHHQQQAPPAFVEPFNLEEPIENPAPPESTPPLAPRNIPDYGPLLEKQHPPRQFVDMRTKDPSWGPHNPIFQQDHFYDEVPERPEYVDFEPDPRVPLILGRSFLKTSRALIDVYEGEITLRVGKEAITFNLDQTLRYTANYNHMTANRFDVIDMSCEEYSQEVIGFSNVIASGNPTPYYDPIVSTSSSTLTPFGDSDFLLFEAVDSFLAIERMIQLHRKLIQRIITLMGTFFSSKQFLIVI